MKNGIPVSKRKEGCDSLIEWRKTGSMMHGKFILDRQTALRTLFLIVVDLIVIELSSFMALFIRFDFTMNAEMVRYLAIYRNHQILVMAITIIIFAFCHMYSSMWTYASIREMVNILVASLLYMLVVTTVYTFL